VRLELRVFILDCTLISIFPVHILRNQCTIAFVVAGAILLSCVTVVFALHLIRGGDLLHLCAFLLTCWGCLLKHWIHRALFVFNISSAKQAFRAGSRWFKLHTAALIDNCSHENLRNVGFLVALLKVRRSIAEENTRLVSVRVPDSNVFNLRACRLLNSLLSTASC